MTFSQTAAAMRRLADGIDLVVASRGDAEAGESKPRLPEDMQVGAAFFLCYLRDLFTTSDRDAYDRASILVILEVMSRDAELFSCGVGSVMWQAEDSDP